MSSSDSQSKTVIDVPVDPVYKGFNELLSPAKPGYPGPPSSPGYPGPPPAYSGAAPGPLTNVPLGQNSTRTFCGNCQSEVLTNVNSSISSRGWVWAILCCLCGTIWISLLALCFPGFRKFSHTCPNCR